MIKLVCDTAKEYEDILMSLCGNGDCDACGNCREIKKSLKADPVDWEYFKELFGSDEKRELEDAADICRRCIFFYIDEVCVYESDLDNYY